MNLFDNIYGVSINIRCDSLNCKDLSWRGELCLNSNDNLDQFNFSGSLKSILRNSITDLFNDLFIIINDSNLNLIMPFKIRLVKCDKLIISKTIEAEIKTILQNYADKNNVKLIKLYDSLEGTKPFTKYIYVFNDNENLAV